MRLKDLTNETIEAMIGATAIRYRVNCDEMNSTIIRQTIQSEHGNYKVDNFNQAFIKHSSGKFVISNKEGNNKPYGDLSALFVCQVLNGFTEFLRRANMNRPKRIEVSKQIEPVKEDPLVVQKKAFDFIDSEFNKNGKCEKGANWSDAFEYMQREGFIVLTKDEKQMFKDNVVEDIKHEIKQNKLVGKMISSLDMALNDDGVLKYQCRKRLIIKHYENSNNNIIKKDS